MEPVTYAELNAAYKKAEASGLPDTLFFYNGRPVRVGIDMASGNDWSDFWENSTDALCPPSASSPPKKS